MIRTHVPVTRRAANAASWLLVLIVALAAVGLLGVLR